MNGDSLAAFLELSQAVSSWCKYTYENALDFSVPEKYFLNCLKIDLLVFRIILSQSV